MAQRSAGKQRGLMFEPAWTRLSLCLSVSLQKLCFVDVVLDSHFSSKAMFYEGCLRLAFLFKSFTDVIFNSSFSSKGVFHRHCLTTRFFLQKLCSVDRFLVTLPFPVNHGNRLRGLPTPPIRTNTRRDTLRILMAAVLS